jgi:hypothetical protein
VASILPASEDSHRFNDYGISRDWLLWIRRLKVRNPRVGVVGSVKKIDADRSPAGGPVGMTDGPRVSAVVMIAGALLIQVFMPFGPKEPVPQPAARPGAQTEMAPKPSALR